MLYFDGPQEGLPPGPYVPEPAAKKHPWMEKPLFSDGGIQQSLSYFQLAACLDGREVMVNINARITPLNATVGTLQIQIFCIGTLFFVLAGLLALWMARFIAKPIEDISRSSKELSRGNYEVYFDGRGYREIAELSDTLNGTAKALRQVERLRQELVANVSHDLRTPLTMIIGYGEAMRDIPGENTAENIQIIIDEAQRLSLLVNDILDISQIEAGMRRMEKGPLNLTQSIRETLSRYQKLVEQQGYAIEFEAGEAAWVLADRVKLDQQRPALDRRGKAGHGPAADHGLGGSGGRDRLRGRHSAGGDLQHLETLLQQNSGSGEWLYGNGARAFDC